MDISSSTSTSSLWSTPQVNGTSTVDSSNGTADAPPAPPPSGHHHHGGGGGMMKDVMQTLKDLGLDSSTGTDASSTGTSAASTTGTDATGSTDTSGTGGTDVKAAMSQFMHDLFQAMQGSKGQSSDGSASDSSASNNSTGPTPAPAYGGIENALQSVISGLNGGSSSGSSTSGDSSSGSSGSDAISKLQGDFKNLLTALGDKGSSGGDDSSSATAASGSTVDLQKFLTTLEQKMQSHAGSNFSTVGNSISTQA